MVKRLTITLLLPLLLVACNTGERGEGVELVAVDATVYRGLMDALGIGDRCVDFSTEMHPNAEAVLSSGARMIMLSMYDGADTQAYERLGIKVVECRDWQETTALGRAQWIRTFGECWGVAARADSLYEVIERNYLARAEATRQREAVSRAVGSETQDSQSPIIKILFDLPYSGVWYQPEEQSSTGEIVRDAGGQLVAQRQPISKEQALVADADVWIIRYSPEDSLSLETLALLDPLYKSFRAYKNANVWTTIPPSQRGARNAYFDEAPFRPDYLLSDLLAIVLATEQGVALPDTLHYFKII